MKIRLLTDVRLFRPGERDIRPREGHLILHGRTFEGARLEADGTLEVIDNVQLGVPLHLLSGEWEEIKVQRQLADWEQV